MDGRSMPRRLRFHHINRLGTSDIECAGALAAREGWFPAPTADLPAGAPPEALRVFLRRSWRAPDGLARALLCRGADGTLYLGEYTYIRPGGRPLERRLFAVGRCGPRRPQRRP